MYLFGGKFCKFTEDNGQERECTCPEIISKHPHCECDRKHFNNILWATVTVFQVNEFASILYMDIVYHIRHHIAYGRHTEFHFH